MPTHPKVPWVQFAQLGNEAFVLACTICRAQSGQVSPTAADQFVATHAAHQANATHYGAGDVVAKVTGALGMKPCTPCEARRLALNQALPRLWRR